eukprot:scaffold7589_cov403-Prasinococcus_capsulatus_cf.AAC.3
MRGHAKHAQHREKLGIDDDRLFAAFEGGYRFIETDLLPGQLVWDGLRLPTACYDYECAGGCEGSGNCYILKDAYGNNAGYALPITTMLGQIEAYGEGQQVFFGKELSGIYAASTVARRHGAAQSTGDGLMKLQFADGSSVKAKRVMLNIPKDALEALDPSSLLFNDGAVTPRTQTFLKAVTVGAMNKVYVFYEDAWWASKLGLMEGTFKNLTDVAPFNGRYHDGPLKCVIGTDPAGDPIYSGAKLPYANCSGALEVYYASGKDYWKGFMSSVQKPLTVVTKDETNSQHRSVIASQAKRGACHIVYSHVHPLRLLEGKTDRLRCFFSPVRFQVTVSNWIKGPKITPGIGDFVGDNTARKAVRAPSSMYEIYVADQDYGYRSGWAVGSLQM